MEYKIIVNFRFDGHSDNLTFEDMEMLGIDDFAEVPSNIQLKSSKEIIKITNTKDKFHYRLFKVMNNEYWPKKYVNETYIYLNRDMISLFAEDGNVFAKLKYKLELILLNDAKESFQSRLEKASKDVDAEIKLLMLATSETLEYRKRKVKEITEFKGFCEKNLQECIELIDIFGAN